METQTASGVEQAVAHLDPHKSENGVKAYEALVATDESATSEALRTLFDERIFEPVTTLILDDKVLAPKVSARMLKHASRPKELVVAHTFAGVMIERNHDALTAETHVHSAQDTNTDWRLATDRSAWYKSDRGEAASASRLWNSIYQSSDPQITVLANYTGTSASQHSRNAPCFCGSGKKFKQCHASAPQRGYTLAERVPWIALKVRCYLERASRQASSELEAMAKAYLTDVDDADGLVDEVVEVEPLVSDAVIFEGGWLPRFLEDRKALLPADEGALVAKWIDAKRSVYEVVSISNKTSVTLRDLRTDKNVVVTDTNVAKHTSKGDFVCGRAVPDGESNQFVGGVLPVEADNTKTMVDIIASSDPEAFLAFAQKSRSTNT